ncbi:hypothetical protein C7M51_02217 [Mixta intestinalis]|uniref:Uncharacterized protein n=1 Tax=Mixta intestinalis TaxID=1615494 RepID=A0A6P1Q0Z3_9GAMM|nr:hypothetical protein C7M51_02217 [Mixta intestinalis]
MQKIKRLLLRQRACRRRLITMRGESKVTDNDAPEERAEHRRVKNRPVPLADDCQEPGETPVSPKEGDAF